MAGDGVLATLEAGTRCETLSNPHSVPLSHSLRGRRRCRPGRPAQLALLARDVRSRPPATAGDAWFLISLFLLLVFIHACAVLLFPGRRALQIVAALLFILAALAAYFRDTFGVLIDKDMIRNVVRTDAREASDFLSLRLVLYIVGLGFIPALVAARVRLPAFGIGRQFIQRGRFLGIGLVVVLLAALPVISHYASFLREHRAIRNLLVPAEPIYAAFDYWHSTDFVDSGPVGATSAARHAGPPHRGAVNRCCCSW